MKEDVVYLDLESFERKRPWRNVQNQVFFAINEAPLELYRLLGRACRYTPIKTTDPTAPKHELYRLLDQKGQPLLPREKDEQ